MSRNYLNSDAFRRDAQRDAVADDARNREARMKTALVHLPEFHAPHDVTRAAEDRQALIRIAELLRLADLRADALAKENPDLAATCNEIRYALIDPMASARAEAERLYDAITEHEANL